MLFRSGRVDTISSTSPITLIHFARAGESAYTAAAGATVTAAQMVVAGWDSDLNIQTVEVVLGVPTVGAGTNYRYRTIIVTGFSAA